MYIYNLNSLNFNMFSLRFTLNLLDIGLFDFLFQKEKQRYLSFHLRSHSDTTCDPVSGFTCENWKRIGFMRAANASDVRVSRWTQSNELHHVISHVCIIHTNRARVKKNSINLAKPTCDFSSGRGWRGEEKENAGHLALVPLRDFSHWNFDCFLAQRHDRIA